MTVMDQETNIQWKWGMLAALALLLLALYPQLHLWAHKGRSWSGAYAYFDRDEVAYSAYLQALIDGRPRRNDPYTGYDQKGVALPESLFSIQFVAPYLVAIPARLFGLSGSTVFIVLMPVAAVLSALALFWFLAMITSDSRLAAVGVLVILCLSTLVSGQGPIGALLGEQFGWSYLPFLRRYLPSVPFPFFLALFGLVWKAIAGNAKQAFISCTGVGLIVALLNYSYFYLWTGALAWLACLAIVWLIARPNGWQRLLYSLSAALLIAVVAAIPYFILLKSRAEHSDQVQAMVYTRRPDLFRPSVVISFILLAGVAYLIARRRISLKETRVLFLISLLLLPFIVFNQQVLTGRSLQPFHYEEFVTSYSVLMTAVIGWGIFCARRSRSFWASGRAIFWIAVVSLAYGANGASGISRAALSDNLVHDQTVVVGQRLRELYRQNEGIAFPVDLRQGDILPTFTPVPVLWAVHTSVFPGSQLPELKERFYHFLYYSHVTPEELNKLLMGRSYPVSLALFGYERMGSHFVGDFKPITEEEIRREVQLYGEYAASFNRTNATKYVLGYFIAPIGSEFDASSLDGWYERDSGERVGDFIIYQLKLKP
ncbi:MAG TPA: hypothetical protein VFH31_01100 [Pyrinomonadaceae bacterium]|nr:hypothetical protein [Pyrinomonadaceae bacterium]